MQSKKERLQKILEIISEQDIETQDELLQALRASGVEVTQATVSRDIRELRLTKTHTSGGRQRYTAVQEGDRGLGDKYTRVMQDAVVSVVQAQNILVIKTVSGMAMAVAAALDALKFNEVVGCIAGDDTIFVAVRSNEETEQLREKIQAML